MKRMFCFFMFLFFLLSCGGKPNVTETTECLDASGDTSKLAQYEITFTVDWKRRDFPTDYPSKPHFSPMVVASHKSSYSMWADGALASAGVQEVAETGKTEALMGELKAARTAKKVCGYQVASEDIVVKNGVATGKITVTVHEDFPSISLITMIAPSPDWFVGISNLNLRNSSTWSSQEDEIANPFDAGTDGGTTYSAPDNSLATPQIISIIMDEPFPPTSSGSGQKPRSLGNFEIKKI